ncbi:MAG TPA: MFS transporter [Solirubrobacteraceae bacterium]|nr:MFS transporter [Solirubrobacteraceae bacterium]
MSEAQPAVIETQVPARLDRLPWSRFHWLVVIGLGTVWILDGIEVTIVGSIGATLTQSKAGVGLNPSTLGSAAAIYVAGACVGALVFGQLTDRFGRKRLFTLTLAVYIAATVATAFSFSPWYFFLCRFVTGMGIGGEYAAINSAIDELIPARVRGRVDLIINGSYWFGAVIAVLVSIVLLDPSLFPINVGWRLSFAVGAVLGLGMILVRRNVPESPRWLFIHGREEEAERIVDEIETSVKAESGADLEEPGDTIKVRPRETVAFRKVARVAFGKYPRRAILGLALFIGQAFLYNAITFDLGTILAGHQFHVAASDVPYFIAMFAAGNLLGPLTLGRLFDTVGRKPMIAGTYLISAVMGVVLGVLMTSGSLDRWSFIALVGVVFFFASAGASAAYLTVSEIFPMETRALAIAFFYAVGTGVGGISGPLLFGNLINTGKLSEIAIGFFIGAAVMAIGGVAELVLGVRAEQKPLEEIAEPLTAGDADDDSTAPPDSGSQEPQSLARARRGRLRPGPGGSRGWPGMPMPAPRPAHAPDREVEQILTVLRERGATRRGDLSRAVGAKQWGPGRFGESLRAAELQGQARRVVRRRGYEATPHDRDAPDVPPEA